MSVYLGQYRTATGYPLSKCFPHQDGVPDEEDGCVVAHEVPGTLLGVEFDGKPSGISDRVSTPRLTT